MPVLLRASRFGGQPSWLASRSSRQASEGWSGRRGSNPRPTAWKAVTLPLSYSRLRAALPRSTSRRFGGQARCPKCPSSIFPVARVHVCLAEVRSPRWLAIRSSRPQSHARAKDGGEGRTRTFEAARATDLQSAAFDRFATSPMFCLWKRVFSVVPKALESSRTMELAKGFEPPTC